MSSGGGAMRRITGGLIAVALTLAGAAVTSTAAQAVPVRLVPADEPAPVDTGAIEAEILVLINASRAGAGLAPVQRNPVLDQAAGEWSAHLVSGGCGGGSFLCHRSRTSMAALAKAASAPHGYRHWAENVQYVFGGAEQSHQRLMGSSGHRANIMRPTTNLVGIGVVVHPSGAIFVTQEYVEAKTPPPPKVTHPCGRITKTLAYGSRSSQVKVLQCALSGLGLYTGTVDGKFGKSTRAALKEFQRQNGLSQSGKTYLSTRRALGVT